MFFSLKFLVVILRHPYTSFGHVHIFARVFIYLLSVVNVAMVASPCFLFPDLRYHSYRLILYSSLHDQYFAQVFIIYIFLQVCRCHVVIVTRSFLLQLLWSCSYCSIVRFCIGSVIVLVFWITVKLSFAVSRLHYYPSIFRIGRVHIIFVRLKKCVHDFWSIIFSLLDCRIKLSCILFPIVLFHSNLPKLSWPNSFFFSSISLYCFIFQASVFY